MTKEQMIDFIREKVILANNPECGSYDERLEYELTLENILVALYKNINIQPLISYPKNGLMSISVIKEQTINQIVNIGIQANNLFLWQPNTLLKNQAEETITAIYNILSN